MRMNARKPEHWCEFKNNGLSKISELLAECISPECRNPWKSCK